MNKISLKSKKLSVDGQTDVRTYGGADGHLRPTLLGRLGGVDLINISYFLWYKYTNTYTDGTLAAVQEGSVAVVMLVEWFD